MSALLLRGIILVLLYVAKANEMMAFKASSSPYHTASPIDSPRDVHTLIECIRVCYHGYTECLSVTFNTKSGSCTPRSMITYDNLIHKRASEDLFFYKISCSAAPGFQLFVHQSAIQCLYIDTIARDFKIARSICSQRASRLITIKSEDKMNLLRNIVKTITQRHTWIGLTDLHVEGTYVWEDQELLTESHFKIPWRIGNPDNAHGGEDCCEIGSWNDFMNVNDINCNEYGQVVCEIDNVI